VFLIIRKTSAKVWRELDNKRMGSGKGSTRAFLSLFYLFIQANAIRLFYNNSNIAA